MAATLKVLVLNPRSSQWSRRNVGEGMLRTRTLNHLALFRQRTLRRRRGSAERRPSVSRRSRRATRPRRRTAVPLDRSKLTTGTRRITAALSLVRTSLGPRVGLSSLHRRAPPIFRHQELWMRTMMKAWRMPSWTWLHTARQVHRIPVASMRLPVMVLLLQPEWLSLRRT